MDADKWKQAVKEYKAIYKKHNGKDLSDAEAEKQARNLLNLFEVLYDNDNQKAGLTESKKVR